MAPVGRRKCIIHIDIAQPRQLAGETLVVLLFFRMETEILQKNDVPFLHRRDRRFRLRADAVIDEDDVLAQQIGQPLRNGLQRVLLHPLAVRPPEMGRKYRLSLLIDHAPYGRKVRLYPRIVGDMPLLVQRHVEVDANQCLFAA